MKRRRTDGSWKQNWTISMHHQLLQPCLLIAVVDLMHSKIAPRYMNLPAKISCLKFGVNWFFSPKRWKFITEFLIAHPDSVVAHVDDSYWKFKTVEEDIVWKYKGVILESVTVAVFAFIVNVFPTQAFTMIADVYPARTDHGVL